MSKSNLIALFFLCRHRQQAANGVFFYRLSLSMGFLRCLCGGFCLLRSCISRRCFNTLCFSGGLCCSLAAAVGFLLTWYSHWARSRLYCSTTLSISSESTHKNLHIRITVRFERIGDFIQPVGNLRFGFFNFYL